MKIKIHPKNRDILFFNLKKKSKFLIKSNLKKKKKIKINKYFFYIKGIK